MTEDLTVERITNLDLFRKTRSSDAIWRCCRHCGADIPPSAPEHAYCDEACKRTSMAIEMGFGPERR